MIGLLAGLLAGVAMEAWAVPPAPPLITTPVTRAAPQQLPEIEVPAVRATAIQSLPTLFSTDDYPAAALRNEETGTVAFAVAIDRDGRASQCVITTSSGSASLDAATCSIIAQRARFEPARDGAGRAVEDRSHGRVRWMLPSTPPQPFADERMVLIFTTDAKGAVKACRLEPIDKLPVQDLLCSAMMSQAKATASAAAKTGAMANRELVIEHGMKVGGLDAVRGIGLGPGETGGILSTFLLEVDPAGAVSYCAGADGAEDGERVAAACRESKKRKFVPLDKSASQSTRHAVRYWAAYTRPIG